MSQTLEQIISTDKDTLLKIIKPISTLNETAVLVIEEEGLTYRAMDASHVALIDTSFPNNCFEKYGISEKIQVAFVVKEFLDIIKSLDKRGTVRINFDRKDMIKISQNYAEFELRRLEDKANDVPLPKIPYDSMISINGSFFKTLLKKIQSVSDYVTVKTVDQNIVLSGKGDNGSVKIPIDRDDDAIQEIRNKQDSQTTFSLEYLIPFLISIVDKNTIINFEYSTSKPCRIDVKINNIGRVHFYLAPRVET